MPRIEIEDWVEESPSHPCIHCKEIETYIDSNDLIRCLNCNQVMEAPKPNKKRSKLKAIKKSRFDDWD